MTDAPSQAELSENHTSHIDSKSKHTRTRRPHRKTRTGCENCKQRRIKCDEGKPQCANCSRHALTCSFVAGYVPTPSSQPKASTRPARFIPSKYELEAQAASSSPESSNPPTVSLPLRPSTQPPSEALTYKDLELLHYYLTTFCSTLTDDPDGSVEVMQKDIPQLGFTYHFLLHLILAISSLHLSRVRPEQRDDYLYQAELHHSRGLRGVTAILPSVNSENCRALYFAGVVICFFNLGRGPRPGEYLAFGEQGRSEWLTLLGGVKFIREANEDQLSSGPLAASPSVAGSQGPSPDSSGSPQKSSRNSGQLLHPHQIEYKERLGHLRQLIETRLPADAPDRHTYIQTLDNLDQSFDDVYEEVKEGKYQGRGASHHVFGWLYRMTGSYQSCLQQKKSLALIIFAYYAILLREIEFLWMVEGWPEHILAGVAGLVDEQDRVWLEWPAQKIRDERS